MTCHVFLRGFAAAAVAYGSFAACNWGTRLKNFPPAMGANGARVAIRVAGEGVDRVGELYAADAAGVIVGVMSPVASRPSRLVFVPWDRLDAMDVAGADRRLDVRRGEPLTPDKRAMLAAISRFPQGLSGDLLQAVLDKLELRTLERVAAMRELDDLADVATAVAARFRDRNEAIRAGYRRVGTDFPSMGEHWILPSALLDGRVDPMKPTMLMFAAIDERPTLLGVGFVVVARGGSTPVGLAGWPAAWHEHSGLLDDESVARARRSAKDPPDARIWVLHAWTLLENPDGRYAAENWALPFARAGVRGSQRAPREAAEALALAVGGDAHLRARLRALTPKDEIPPAVDDAIGAARVESASIVRRWARDTFVTDADIADLASVWRSLRTSLVASIGPAAGAIGSTERGHNHMLQGKP